MTPETPAARLGARELVDVVEHPRELLAHPLLLLLVQLEVCQAGYVEHLITAQHAPEV